VNSPAGDAVAGGVKEGRPPVDAAEETEEDSPTWSRSPALARASVASSKVMGAWPDWPVAGSTQEKAPSSTRSSGVRETDLARCTGGFGAGFTAGAGSATAAGAKAVAPTVAMGTATAAAAGLDSGGRGGAGRHLRYGRERDQLGKMGRNLDPRRRVERAVQQRLVSSGCGAGTGFSTGSGRG